MTEDINNLKISFAKMENKIENVEKTVIEIKDALNCYIEKAESRYAGKWVEKWALGLIIATAGVVAKLVVDK